MNYNHNNRKTAYIALALFIIGFALFSFGFFNIQSIIDGYPKNAHTDYSKYQKHHYWIAAGVCFLISAIAYSVYSKIAKYSPTKKDQNTAS